MTLKCVRQGCGKEFADESEEPCVYHPGPPIFHEGQKGWKCCKPRVLTFDEFMDIPPCTTGKHSTTEKPPAVEDKPPVDEAELARKIEQARTPTPAARLPIQPAQHVPTPPLPQPESEEDDPSLEIPDGAECRRRTCDARYARGYAREDEECVHHPGVPIFHEGSKGFSCCKRRVLEFDQFMRIEGCTAKGRHLFIGSGKKKEEETAGSAGEEVLATVRHDFYQTPTQVIASFFLKKINKETAKIEFREGEIDLDLTTTDPIPKRYTATVPMFSKIDPAQSKHKILGTKLEVSLAKADGASWPVLRGDEQLTGEILQVGRAGKAA